MKHFINLKDIPSRDLKKIIIDAKRRKNLRKKLFHIERGIWEYISEVVYIFSTPDLNPYSPFLNYLMLNKNFLSVDFWNPQHIYFRTVLDLKEFDHLLP